MALILPGTRVEGKAWPPRLVSGVGGLRSQTVPSTPDGLGAPPRPRLSTSKSAKPLALLYMTMALILLGGVCLHLVLEQPFMVACWNAWTWVADAGSHVEVEAGTERFIAFALTIGGMLVFALLMGLVADELGEKVDDLKKGRSRVLEREHTVILNWSNKSLPLIQELAVANESQGGTSIVLLCPDEKEEVEDRVEAAGINLRGSRVIVRSGSAIVFHDLQRVGCAAAKSIILLAEEGVPPEENDAKALRTILSLREFLPKERKAPHIVVEVSDVDNRELISIVGKVRAPTRGSETKGVGGSREERHVGSILCPINGVASYLVQPPRPVTSPTSPTSPTSSTSSTLPLTLRRRPVAGSRRADCGPRRHWPGDDLLRTRANAR